MENLAGLLESPDALAPTQPEPATDPGGATPAAPPSAIAGPDLTLDTPWLEGPGWWLLGSDGD